MTELDALIERARGATVDRASAERYVRELDRWARPVAQPRRWGPWLLAGFAVAAVTVGFFVLGTGGRPERTIVALGERVAIVAEPGTAYRVVRAAADETTIAVERGVVTARLWPGTRGHRLALTGGGVTAVATGTVYSLAIGPGGPAVQVLEGTVDVHAAGVVHVVHAGTRWPPEAAAVSPVAGRMLLASSALPVAASTAAEDAGLVAGDAGISPDAGGAVDAGIDAQAVPAPAGDPPRESSSVTAPATIKDHWRVARLLRGQGRFAAAVDECITIADARHPVWSPIALVEGVRILLGPLAEPERAIALADRMLREWPRDALAADARELRCRAFRQLGRGGECAAQAAPSP